jgi:hypothetical protein
MYLSILLLLKCWSSIFIPERITLPCCEINRGNGTDTGKLGINKRAIHSATTPSAKSADKDLYRSKRKYIVRHRTPTHIMQLPRGTFREIRKSVAIESLLKELDGEKYTGVASISSPSLTGTLVFKAGKCILVKFQNNRGDTAMEELLKDGGQEVDAVLSLLGDAQIDLALEFNRQFRILKSGKHVPALVSHRAAPSASRESPRSVSAQKPAAPAAPLKHPLKPGPSPQHVPAPTAAPQAPAPSSPLQPPRFSKAAAQVPPSPRTPYPRHEDGKKREADEQPEKDGNSSIFESDLDTFDIMDIENVTDKIRTDCKTMIKQLQLEHLLER